MRAAQNGKGVNAKITVIQNGARAKLSTPHRTQRLDRTPSSLSQFNTQA